MKGIAGVFVIATVVALSGCAGLQVQRDLDHAADVAAYRASLGTSVPFASMACDAPPATDAWIDLEFGRSTPVYALPGGMASAAVCFVIPSGAKMLQIYTPTIGGMTFHEATVVHPSLIFLREDGSVLEDIVTPRLAVNNGWVRGYGLSGNLVLNQDLRAARRVVVYVHPDSLDRALTVHTGYESIPVPYNAYGTGQIRFQ